MDPLVGAAIIGGVGNIAGDLFSQSNAREAFKHRYQDTVADMRAAGLNPALAYGQGGGNPQTMSFDNWGSGAASAGAAIASAKQAKANAELTTAQADLLKAQKDDLVLSTHARAQVDTQLPDRQRFENIISEMNSLMAQRSNARDIATYDSSVEGANARNKAEALRAQLMQLSLPQAKALAKWWRNHPDIGGWANSAGGIAKILETLGTAAQNLR